MAFSKKTWKDRVSQYINRRLLTDSDGNTQQVTVTRDEGSVTEAGDAFSAANMNDLEDRIDNAFDGLTAADIPYSSGVSVADMLDVEDLSSQVTLRNGYDIASWGNLKLIKYGHLCHLSFSGVGTSNSITSDTPIIDLPVTSKFFSTGSAFQRSGSINKSFNFFIDGNTTQVKCNAFEPLAYAYGCLTFFV